MAAGNRWTTEWDQKYAERIRSMRSSIIRDLLKVTQQPQVISFAGGLPAAELFPVREFREACEHILQHSPEVALQYGPTEGYAPLKEFLAGKVRKYGVPAVPGNIMPTCGSQQALDLIGRVFLNKGDVILTEAPTYLGALQAWNAYQPRYVTVPIDENGIQVDLVEDTIKKEKPKFMYILPNFHNPGGTTIPLERRKKLVEIASGYNIFIVEDDPYGELRFEGEDITPLISMHKENVIYLSTFSKTLAPGIRLGWMIAPERVMEKVVLAKQGTDLHTSTFVQAVAYDICSRGLLRSHVVKIRSAYRERRNTMLHALEEFFPEGIKWTRPEGGLFLFTWLPEKIDTEKLLQAALQEKVAFVPGFAFYPDGSGRNTMRLNFSCMNAERIREGIERLGKAIKRELKG